MRWDMRYLQDIISEKAWTLLADDRLVNPFLVPFLKMANLHPQNQETARRWLCECELDIDSETRKFTTTT